MNNACRSLSTRICLAAAFFAAAISSIPQQPRPHPRPVPLPVTACVTAVSTGEAGMGKSFSRPIGGGLVLLFDPTPTGWVVRVLPSSGARPPHDYAELATPPYQSINPLLLTTDFNFRAQDVVGWNPRHFQFFAHAAQAATAQHAYDYYFAHPNDAQAINRLAELPQSAALGTLTLLDAHLVPGTANQSPSVAALAANFSGTQHSLDQSPSGGSPSGRIDWLRFRIDLQLPAGFPVAAGWQVDRSRCPR
jgi:hypothetical protein